MRFGIWGTSTVFLIIFLVMLNTSQSLPSEKVDELFQGIDANVNKDLNLTDANLTKFVGYTVSGIVKEFHGGYYLASWFNTFLPPMIMDNLTLITFLIILALISPLLFYLFLIAVFIVLETKNWLKKRNTKEFIKTQYNTHYNENGKGR
jgi:hypothetical protein